MQATSSVTVEHVPTYAPIEEFKQQRLGAKNLNLPSLDSLFLCAVGQGFDASYAYSSSIGTAFDMPDLYKKMRWPDPKLLASPFRRVKLSTCSR